MKTVTRYLWLSQISLVSLLVLCCLILPSVVIRNGGVSNFGNAVATVVPYTLSFVLSSVFLCLAAYELVHLSSGSRRIAALLVVMALLNILVLLSTFPRHRSLAYSELHDDLGIVLFAYQFVLSIWFVAKRHNLQSSLMLLTQAIGSLIGLLSIIKIIHFLFIGQLVGAAAFGLLLVIVFPAVLADRLKKQL